MRKIWLVKFPTDQYKQDVKSLARKNDLVIFDEKFRSELNSAMFEESPPRLTKKSAARVKKAEPVEAPESSE